MPCACAIHVTTLIIETNGGAFNAASELRSRCERRRGLDANKWRSFRSEAASMFTAAASESAALNFESGRSAGDTTAAALDVSRGASTRGATTRSAGASSHQSAAVGAGGHLFLEECSGHLNLTVVLQTLAALVDRCAAIRVNKLVLNACDTFHTMPGYETLALVDGIVRVCARAYTLLGCPSGCSEGMRTARSDFMRLKLRNLFSQMHARQQQRAAHAAVA